MPSFWLEYTQDGQQRQFSFDNSNVTVGRDKAADFVLDHPTVSRQHAMIQAAQHGGFQLVVLSQGGLTAIDGGPVYGEVPLFDGSEIHFGQLSFTFRSHDAPRRPDPTANPAIVGFAPSAVPHAQPAAASTASGGIDWNSPAEPESPQWGAGAAANQPQFQPAFQAPTQPAAPPQPSPTADGGIVSWDQIAASADAMNDERDGRTDFERIQAAQAKAEKQGQKTSPALVIIGCAAIVGVMGWTFWPSESDTSILDADQSVEELPFISWVDGDIDCVGQANCTAQALTAFKLGTELADKSTTDIKNPYEAYKQFDRAQRLLEVGGVTELPAEMANVAARQAELKEGLEAKFRQTRANVYNHRTRKMYRDMVRELDSLQAYFPDKRAKYYQWALEREREMKDQGVYPVTPRF